MSKELLYKVSESIVFFTASNPLPWHLCHLSPLHNKDLERAEVFNYQEAIMENHSLLGMSHLRSLLHSLCWEKDRENGRRQSCGKAQQLLGRGVPGRCFLGCLSVFQDISSQTRCFTVGELLLRL